MQAVLVLKTTFCLPQLYFTLNLKVMPLECGDDIWRQKTRITGLPYGEEIMVVNRTMCTLHNLRVYRRTDRQTDGQIYDD